MASTPITAPNNTVVESLRDFTDGSASKTGSVTRFLESRKIRVAKNPPPPPARITKATTDVPDKAGQKSVISCANSGPFYDDAWDIRLPHLAFQPAPLGRQQQQRGRGPPDGAATCESAGLHTSLVLPSAEMAMLDSITTATTTAATSTFTSSLERSNNQTNASSKVASSLQSDTAPLDEKDSPPANDVASPTRSSNCNWFPPPPPTPLHLSLHADEPVSSQPGRYHEHRRSFEMNDDQAVETKQNSGDSITLPPISPPPPNQESGSVNDGGRAQAVSSLLNLPPPPLSWTDIPAESVHSPPVIPPRDPKTSVTTPTDPLVTDLDWQQPVLEITPHVKPKDEFESARVKQHRQKSSFDGRSVVPWERVILPTSAAIDFSGSLPQWVPPQHSEAAVLHHRTKQSIGHRPSKSQSGCEDLIDKDHNLRSLSGRSQSQHRRRRHTSHSIGDAFADATNGSSGRREAVRMNSDSSGMTKASCTRVPTGDVWAAAVACNENDSESQFVHVGYDVRRHPDTRSSAHHQRPSGANQSKALAAAAIANTDMMTQSLVDWPGCEDAFSAASGFHHQRQQQRICRRMKAVHLADSGLVLPQQDGTSLPVHHGRHVFFSSSNATSPGDAPPDGGYFFQSQVSCPPYLGGKMSADEAIWADGRVFEYQTAPAQAYPGQAYMLWPQNQLVNGQRRRRHQNHHHPTQPIIVPAGGGNDFSMDVLPNARPQVLVTGRNRGKRATNLAALVSLPVEEQPWFHGRLPRAEAESLLRTAPPGSFLVRISETSKAAFSLSIRRDRDFLHMKISYDPKFEAFILGEYSQPYPTVPIMVRHYSRNLLPVRGTKPVLLKYPLCRAIGSFALHTP